MKGFLISFVRSYDSILFRDFEYNAFGWIRIGLSSSAFILLSLSLLHITFFAAIYRNKLKLLKNKSKQFYNAHLKNYSNMYLFLSLIIFTTALFELCELIGHSIITSKPEIFRNSINNNGCILHEFTTMTGLTNTHFLFLAPPITPNLLFPLLLTFVYTFLIFTARMFLPDNKSRLKACAYSLHIFLWGIIQISVSLILYSNPWTLAAAPFVFSAFILIDLSIFVFYALYLRKILKSSCRDVICYTNSTHDISQIISFYQAYTKFMITFLISFLLLSISMILTTLFDGIRSFILNDCYYSFELGDPTDYATDKEINKIIIVSVILLKFVSMVLFDLFASACSVIVCVKVVAFYRELCLASKQQQQQTRPLLRNF